jgi:hypothetical protein
MQMVQLSYVSSYIDEYGVDLPGVIYQNLFKTDQGSVCGMTLFCEWQHHPTA